MPLPIPADLGKVNVRVTQSTSQLAALRRLFSSAVFREFAKNGRSTLFARLMSQANWPSPRSAIATVSDAFDAAFSILKGAGLRDEYIYRAALTQKILMGRHSLRSASMLNEFRTGSCKADLVILNGTATVYEIKSERDSLFRLANQVANYKRVFASVNVIAGDNHVAAALKLVPATVGVMRLSQRHQIRIEREAIDQPDRICPTAVFESLRSAEVIAILRALGVVVPKVPNTLRRAVLRNRFAELEPIDVHSQMVQTLRRTRNLAPLSQLIHQLPKSLHAAALSIPVRRADHHRLVEAVGTPICVAMAWV